MAGDGLGATLWLPVGDGHDADEGDEFADLEAAIGPQAMKRFGILDDMMSANHPRSRTGTCRSSACVRSTTARASVRRSCAAS